MKSERLIPLLFFRNNNMPYSERKVIFMTFKELKQKQKVRKAIDFQIQEVKKEMLKTDLDDSELLRLSERLEGLYGLKNTEKETKWKPEVKFDINGVIQSCVGLVAITMILTYEDEGIVTTKAMPIAMKFLGR